MPTAAAPTADAPIAAVPIAAVFRLKAGIGAAYGMAGVTLAVAELSGSGLLLERGVHGGQAASAVRLGHVSHVRHCRRCAE